MMTKLTSVKRKASVGERILITDASITGGKYANGDVLTVRKQCPMIYDLIYAYGVTQPIHTDEYVIIEDCATDRILTEAEAKIKTLEAEVKALKDASKPSTIVVNSCVAKVSAEADIERITSETAKGLAKVQPTPNQRRAVVIKRAQAYLEEYDSRGTITNRDGFRAPTGIVCDVEFIVNAEKRTVVCLLRAQFSRDIEAKGVAKCAPGDVFNADIGKRIALGRAREVEVPAEFYNAPQPTEVVVGHRIHAKNYRGKEFLLNVEEIREGTQFHDNKQRRWVGAHDAEKFGGLSTNPVIIDDTDAVYV